MPPEEQGRGRRPDASGNVGGSNGGGAPTAPPDGEFRPVGPATPPGWQALQPAPVDEFHDRVEALFQGLAMHRLDDARHPGGVGRLPLDPGFQAQAAGPVADAEAVEGMARQVGLGNAQLLPLHPGVPHRADRLRPQADGSRQIHRRPRHRAFARLVGLHQFHLVAAEEMAAGLQHGHELEHQDIGVGTQQHRELRRLPLQGGAGGKLDQGRRRGAAESRHRLQLPPRTGMDNDGRFASGLPAPGHDLKGMAQLVGSEELTGELAGTDDDDLHGKAEGRGNQEYSEAPACCPDLRLWGTITGR